MPYRDEAIDQSVTLVFTDIEGSTQHWEERPDEMSQALQRHDQLIRGAIEANGGRVFKTIGDAFCAVFRRPSDAVAATLDAQRSLLAQDWSAVRGLAVRMAVHSGAADERDGDFFGRSVNRVARLLSTVHGGQVVISGASEQLLGGTLPDHVELRDLGEHRLKDLVEPERVWQLLAPGLPETFPPLRSLQSFPNNLPRQLTALIGRDEVVAEIEALVNEHPLVTIVGTGGVGKTRVALQVGADLLDAFGDGVWFVDLAPLSDPSPVAGAIASVLGLREQSERPTLDLLLHHLKRKRLLLIFDNCEHVIEEATKIADTILRSSPEVRLLATSREPLRIAGEHVYRLPSLAVPPESASLTADAAMKYGAVALLTQRAVASDATFQLTDTSAPVVAEICRRLDGIALAIELAAARVKVLGLRQLAQKLNESFRVLTRGSRTALPRQQTMRALIDWSYDLLSPEEQKLFRRLSIFAGGWTLEAAEAVTSDDTIVAADILDLLSSLSEKSLVVAEADERRPRYRLLESTRDFALDKLIEHGEQLIMARRHAQWVNDLANRADVERTVPIQPWVREFEPEFENVRSAFDWALSFGEVSIAACIAAGLSEVWESARGEGEPRRWLEIVVPRIDEIGQPVIAARALRALAAVSFGTRKIEAAERALEFSPRDDPISVAATLFHLAWGLLSTGRAEEAETAIIRALQVRRENGLTRSFDYARALDLHSNIAAVLGREDEARRSNSEERLMAIALGGEQEAAVAQLNLAELELMFGNVRRAIELAQAAGASFDRAELKRVRIIAVLNSAAYRLLVGDINDARVSASEALTLAQREHPHDATIAIQHLATADAVQGDVRRGARLRGYVDAWYRGEGCEREPTEQRTYEILMTALREKLNNDDIEALAAEGAHLSEAQAAAQALAV